MLFAGRRSRIAPRRGSSVLAAGLVGVLAGCAGSGAGLDANGQPIGAGGGSTTPLTADFASIQANVFTPICTRCHAGASAPQGLQLDADHSYGLLVGVASVEAPSLMRVKAGDPDNSYLIKKLEGASDINGFRMPYGGPYLDQATINVIRQWITNGAAKAAATAPSASSHRLEPGRLDAAISAVRGGAPAASAFAVIATSPLRDAILTAPVHQIVVAFNNEVDLSLANSSTLLVRKLAVQQLTAGMTAEQQIPVSISLAPGNPATILLTPAAPLGAGTYQVTLRGSEGGALADVNAQALGGDDSFGFTVDITP